jgi:hypothetical protein
LPYFSGEILRIESLGNALVLYAEDSIMFGTPPNIKDLPVTFQRVETGRVGTLGTKAVVPWLDGHFFAGQDDIYFLSATGEPQKIGTPVVSETLETCSSPWRVYAVTDPTRYRIIFGFPRESSEGKIQRLWSYEYRSQAWSYDEVETFLVANPVVSESLTWNDLTGDWTAAFSTLGVTWGSLSVGEDIPRRALYVEYLNGLMRSVVSGTSDPSGDIAVELVTPDYDFGQADVTKTITRLALRFDNTVSSDVSFTVEGSTNEGESYRSLGTLVVPAGKHEGYVNFRLSGTALRFRLRSFNDVEPYAIQELSLRLRARSTEFSLMSQAS